jgi:RNA polymerase sigma-70 factor (sigma-E family)
MTARPEELDVRGDGGGETVKLYKGRPAAVSAVAARPAPAPPAPDTVDGPLQELDLRNVERAATITRLFDAHHAELTRLAALLGAGAESEDLVAEAFYRIQRKWGGLRDPDAALPYLRSIVCNLARQRYRHQQVVQRHQEMSLQDVGSAESEVVLREDQREVVVALQALPDRQREALVLRYWLDLNEAEVAKAMGISTGAVKSHTSRGMAALARQLGWQR